MGGGDFDHVEHCGLALAHGKTADGVAVEADLYQSDGALLAEIRIGAALHDAE